MSRFNHTYDFAFDVQSDKDDGSDVTPDMLITALRHRIDRIEREDKAEFLEACGLLDSTEQELARWITFSTYDNEDVQCLSEADFRGDMSVSDDMDEYVWQFAATKEIAITQHYAKMDEWHADPTKETY